MDERSHISAATYCKLVAAEECRAFKRIVVLDVDLVVLADIGELFAVDLAGNVLAAAQDAISPTLGSLCVFPAGEPGDAGLPYFNSGVMVVGVARWLADDTAGRAIEFARDPSRIKVWEQDALNGVLVEKWTALDPRWNCFPISELARHQRVRTMLATDGVSMRQLRAVEAEAKILHFVGRDKPWLDTYPDRPNRRLYRSY